MAEITGVAFKEGGKVYYFAPESGCKYEKGKGVIVETARGVEYGTVVIPYAQVDDEKIVTPLKPVIRAATPRDDETHKKNLERKDDAMQTVRERIAKFNLEMKLIDCEFTFDGTKAVFYYSAPQRVDFRELVKDLSSIFRMRIELRQVGIRDEIKMFGGLAPCGRECCCASCMPDLKKVSIKMAKNQGLSLNPGKISGLCGRLMCCLAYENDYYSEACKQMPKIGSEIDTPDGKGMVVNANMLKMEVRVKIEDKEKDLITYKDYPVDLLNSGSWEKNVADNSADSDDYEDDIDDILPEPAEVEVKTEKKKNKNKNNNKNNNNKNYNKNNKNSKENKEVKANIPQDGKQERNSKRFTRPKNGKNFRKRDQREEIQD